VLDRKPVPEEFGVVERIKPLILARQEAEMVEGGRGRVVIAGKPRRLTAKKQGSKS
jgi:hypothetical protein